MREQRIIDPTQAQRAYSTDVQGASLGHSKGTYPEDRPHLTDEQQRVLQPQTRRPVQYQYDDGTQDDEAVYDTRTPSSARRSQVPATQTPRMIVRYHRQQIPPRSSRTQNYTPPVQPQQQQPQTSIRPTKPTTKRAHVHRQWHWLVYVGLTCIAVLVVLVGGSLVLAWWHGLQDDMQYGRPRTAQYDVRVGHGDNHTPSHFLAVNLHKQIEIIEFPGGDATKARVYVGPTLVGDGEDVTPVTLAFKDVNRNGKPDMIVQIGESRTIFINDNGAFRLAKPTDTITLWEERTREGKEQMQALVIFCHKREVQPLLDAFEEWNEEARVVLYGTTNKGQDGFIITHWTTPIPTGFQELQLKADPGIIDYVIYDVPPFNVTKAAATPV